MNMWMMGEADVIALHKDFERAQSAGQTPMAMASTVERGEKSSIMRLRGPLIARSNVLTEMFGLTTTEEHMANFVALRDEGKPIVMDIDGPGGQVPLMFEFAEMIHAAGDQVTAYTGGIAASAHMLLFSAASKRLAHHSATLGSIGVIAYVPYKSGDEVVSSNADNKIPSRQKTQERADLLETKFLDTLSVFLDKSNNAIVSAGDSGGLLLGDKALAAGFVTELSDSESVFKLSTEQTDGNSMTPEEHETAVAEKVKTAVASNNERWELMLAHENSGNHDAVSEIAKMPIDNSQALAMMAHVKAGAPAAPAPAPAPAEGSEESEGKDTPAPAAFDVNAMATAVAAALAPALADNERVPGATSETEEDDAPDVSDEDRGANDVAQLLGIK